MATVGNVYIEKFQRKLDEFNHSRELVDYLRPYVTQGALIADIGSGPMTIIGDHLDGYDITVIPSDILVAEYQELWDKHDAVPFVKVFYENMERLMYPDETFDIVHCRNALDHTPDAYKAISELKRVCKKGGVVYLLHAEGQKRRYRGHHYHNFEELNLPEFEHSQEGELITSIWRKI